MSEMVVPEGWHFRKLGEFAKEIKGRNRSNGNIPVLSVTKYDGFVHSLEYFKKQVFSRDTSGYKKVTKGDFAYATIHLDEGSLGLLKDWDAGLISPMYTVFRVNNKLNPDFLFFLMKSGEYMRKYPALGQGSINRRASISFSILSQLDIHYPPLPEQQKIASILASVDEVIEKTEAQISKLQALKKGMMQELLSKGIGHTKFKDSPVGRIPRRWKVPFLGSLLSKKPKNGLSPSETENENSICSLGLGCLTLDGFAPRQIKTVTNSEKVMDYLLCDGDFLMSRSNTKAFVGLVGIYRDIGVECIYPDLMIRLRFNHQVDPLFLQYVLLSPLFRREISNAAQGTSSTMVKINSEILQKIKILLPSLEEQREIARHLEGVKRTMISKQKILNQYKSIKQGTMQDLITGKVRVKVY